MLANFMMPERDDGLSEGVKCGRAAGQYENRWYWSDLPCDVENRRVLGLRSHNIEPEFKVIHIA
ncbi:Uncharacterised protein [Serratia proteamaculans]|nr:Uncharacterised protein [Serratia proteamaculans]